MGLDLFFPLFFPCLIMNLLFQGRGEAANSDFVPFVGDPRERRGVCSISTEAGVM